MQSARIPMNERDARERARSFQEVNLGYSRDQALKEARRCLQCKARPCVSGCPVGVLIPDFVKSVAEDRPEEALRILGSLYEHGMTAPLVIATLYSNFRRLLVAVELLGRKRPFQEIVRQLNLWSYKGRERQVRRYRETMIREILLQLHASDRACKTTGLDEKTHLERVIVDTCRKTSI